MKIESKLTKLTTSHVKKNYDRTANRNNSAQIDSHYPTILSLQQKATFT